MTKTTKKLVLVTGCTDGGTGSAIAKEFQARGCHVIATSRRLDSMATLKNVPDVTLLELDVTSIESIRAAKTYVETNFGRLDVLVNNAGIAAAVPALDHEMSSIRKIFDTNIFGLMSMVQEFVPLLLLGKNSCIVNVGSNAALVPFAFSTAYNASKAAVHSYSDTLRVELKPLGIQVTTVILGGVKSNIYSYPSIPLPKNSHYLPIEETYKKARAGNYDKSSPPETVARQLVAATLRNSPPRRLRVGTGSTFMSILAWLLPLSLIESATASFLGLKKLASIRAANFKAFSGDHQPRRN
ncbi:hypothetical protein FRC17_001159 [Serendipita sp. 399]|nr:hypothetical protein FRC17_001159 [Serendipita sp. 399]